MVELDKDSPLGEEGSNDLSDKLIISSSELDLNDLCDLDPALAREIVEAILQMDYEECRRWWKESDVEPNVSFSNITVSKFRDDRYWVRFARTFEGVIHSCWYQFDSNIKTEGRTIVYGARLDNQVVAVDSSGKLERLGSFESLLDQSVEDRLAEKFRARRNKALFFKHDVLHNDSGDYEFQRENGAELLRQGRLSIEEYLERATYVFKGYETDVPARVVAAANSGKSRIMELWQSDVTFVGHVRDELPPMPEESA